MSEIYEPAEDSYLMSTTISNEIPKLLKENPNLKFLEIGAGSGINLKAALESGIKINNIFGIDINVNAVNLCKSLGFNCVKSNLFEAFEGSYDIIIFNPPYLPEDKNEPKDSRQNTTGGKKGNEITIKFLKQAKNFLNKSGIILLITSSLTKPIDFKKLKYKAEEIASKKLFFEKICVLKLKLIE